jgi:hypothetical protein
MRISLNIAVGICIAALTIPVAAGADGLSDIHITPDGLLVAKNITVYQISKYILYTRATWGQPFIRITVLATASTTVLKSHGEPGSVGDISEKDLLDATGTLSVGGDSIVVNATEIRDTQLLIAQKTISGIVKSVGTDKTSFVIQDKTLGATTVALASGGQITKGARTISLTDIGVGDKILSAAGTYDYSTNTLTASSITVFQDKSIFVARNFQGTLKSVTNTQLPTTVVVTMSGTDYTVYLPQNASILNNKKSATTLSRFVAGDTVRFYGSIRQTNLTEVDSDTLRDLNF